MRAMSAEPRPSAIQFPAIPARGRSAEARDVRPSSRYNASIVDKAERMRMLYITLCSASLARVRQDLGRAMRDVTLARDA